MSEQRTDKLTRRLDRTRQWLLAMVNRLVDRDDPIAGNAAELLLDAIEALNSAEVRLDVLDAIDPVGRVDPEPGEAATCGSCGRPFGAVGCAISRLRIEGEIYDRIKVGDDSLKALPGHCGRCGDCGAALGMYHHRSCDMEQCGRCFGQLISCECEDVADAPAKEAE